MRVTNEDGVTWTLTQAGGRVVIDLETEELDEETAEGHEVVTTLCLTPNEALTLGLLLQTESKTARGYR